MENKKYNEMIAYRNCARAYYILGFLAMFLIFGIVILYLSGSNLVTDLDNNYLIIIIALFVISIVFLILGSRNRAKFIAIYKSDVVKNLSFNDCDFLDILSYEPNRGITWQTISELGVIACDRFESNDLITANYKGVNFRQSDVHMQVEVEDDEGNTSYSTVFKGRWMIFDFNKDFNWNLQIKTKGFASVSRMGGLRAKKENVQKIQLENEDFNRCFKVFTQDPHEAYYILTPHIMEAMLKVVAKINVHTLFMFHKGKLHVAIYNNRDAFEGKLFGEMDLEKEKKRIIEDIRLVTNFVDVLALERNIFKTN